MIEERMMDAMTAFRQVLDPADNSTGGGTASALAGAMAAALAAMVARLSVGKGQGEPDAFYEELACAGEGLTGALAAGGADDAAAFDAVKAAYRLPKNGDEERAARTAAIQAALVKAAQVPLENAGLCSRALAMVELLEGRCNPTAHSDLQCAGYLARAGLAGCLANVAINLPGIKDAAVAAAIQERVAVLHDDASLAPPTEAA